ncbi:MAG: hypothetical protein LBH43_00375 [Treponema sp.]|jgi:hypothetical protein|nr:hypothetical protein [Treponema sp.]
MKNTIKWLGIIALVAVIGFTMVSCDNGNGGSGSTGGLSGTWRGTIQGATATVTITSSGWTFTASGLSDRGTYTMDGITARLFSTVYSMETGTAVLLDSNTISITLNQNSAFPGTYTLFRV